MNKLKMSKFLISILLLGIVMISLMLSPLSPWIVSVTGDFLSSVDRVVAIPFNYFAKEKKKVVQLIETYQENETLKGTIYNLEEKANISDSLKLENEQLRSLLELRNNDQSAVKIAAEVISRSPSTWNNELTLDKGQSSDVSTSMLAISNGGLIGAVTSVSDSSSVVSLLTNEKNDSSIAIKIKTQTGFAYGIIVGFDTEKSAFIVSQLNTVDGIEEGATVTTSGLGSYNAENVLVGQVLSISAGKDQLNKEVLVKPAADLSDIQAVLLVRN
ncbi:rod shape-determining protein MreC [Streptococcus cristatus]|uniref:rod shape-determining protein MreC n=1 Tax=Streptococcus cristatus TaxID=45634 RepID=UPI0039C01D98